MLHKLFILFKGGVKSQQHSIFLGICILLVSVISYNIGKINALQKTPIKITNEEVGQASIYQATNSKSESLNPKQIQNTKPEIPKTDLRVVVSKKSTTKKYHYTWCSGTQRIKEENKRWFNSAQEAEAAGYTLAGNCQL